MQKLYAKCEDCLLKPGSSNEDIVRGTGGASEKSDDVNDFHYNNNDQQSDAHNSEDSKEEDKLEDRMCEFRWHCLGKTWQDLVSSSDVHTKWNPWTCSAKIN